MEIPKIKLNDGNSIPAIALGTWGLRGRKCAQTVKLAIEMGYTHIDTAEAYTNPKEIGRAIAGFEREKLFITSKVWHKNLGFDSTLRACNETLESLGADYLDLYLIHWPNRAIPMQETFDAFAELKKQGKVKSFGVSNFTIRHLEAALPVAKKAGLAIANNQCEFHPHLYQKELLEYCGKKGISFTAYSPLARGAIFRDAAIKRIAEKHGKNAGQVSLKWILQKGAVVIPKASSEGHLKQNLDLFGWGLSEAEVSEIDSIGVKKRVINPCFGEFDDNF